MTLPIPTSHSITQQPSEQSQPLQRNKYLAAHCWEFAHCHRVINLPTFGLPVELWKPTKIYQCSLVVASLFNTLLSWCCSMCHTYLSFFIQLRWRRWHTFDIKTHSMTRFTLQRRSSRCGITGLRTCLVAEIRGGIWIGGSQWFRCVSV